MGCCLFFHGKPQGTDHSKYPGLVDESIQFVVGYRVSESQLCPKTLGDVATIVSLWEKI